MGTTRDNNKQQNNPKTLNKQDLENMGLNLKDYNVTQECIIEDITSRKDVNKYLRKLLHLLQNLQEVIDTKQQLK